MAACFGTDRGLKAAPTGRAFGGEGVVVDGKETERAVESPGSRPRARPSCGPKAQRRFGSSRLTRNVRGKARKPRGITVRGCCEKARSGDKPKEPLKAPDHAQGQGRPAGRRKGLPPTLWEPLAPEDDLGSRHREIAQQEHQRESAGLRGDRPRERSSRSATAGPEVTRPAGFARPRSRISVASPVVLSLLDGLRNVLPSGAPLRLYQQSSCLVDAYKRVDVDPETRLGIFSLTARISDRPEPAEELRASTVWCHGLPDFRVALSLDAVRAFRRGETRARRARPDRAPRKLPRHVDADAGTGRTGRVAHRRRYRTKPRPDRPAARPVACSPRRGLLDRGLPPARQREPAAHRGQRRRHPAHRTRRGFRPPLRQRALQQPAGRRVRPEPLRPHGRPGRLSVRRATAKWRPDTPDSWPGYPRSWTSTDLHRAAEATADPDLRRLCLEYLPLYFGRRHGDPSRPWNRFSICVRNPDGSQALRYEGNWRDVFQNWEALTRSFPGFIPSVIAKFVNASTVDGFNPYRITRDGIDWEVLDPEDPWSGIGYWGDHQIVYLLKFLESMPRHFPGVLEGLLGQEIFCYAEVPYRLEPYAEMLGGSASRPSATTKNDAARIAERVAAERRRRQARPRRRRDDPSTPACSRSCSSRLSPSCRPRARRRHLDEHPAARVERREQRARGPRPLRGHPVSSPALPAIPGRTTRGCPGPGARSPDRGGGLAAAGGGRPRAAPRGAPAGARWTTRRASG